MAGIPIRVEFSLFPDNTVLGPQFTLNNFEFTDTGANPSFVNMSGAEKGLQFADSGVRVKLPIRTSEVNVRAAAFATDVTIVGRNSAGTPVAFETIPGDNTPHAVRIVRPNLASLEFRGGNNEGLIEDIAYHFDCDTQVAPMEPVVTEHAGPVRDIDFVDNKVQVLIGNDALLVADDRLQSVLEAAFVSEREVRVVADDKHIRSATIFRSPTAGCSDDGCVSELTCSPDCTAIIQGYGEVTTIDPRAIGVLLAAVADDRPVMELVVDAQRVIRRVKVNRG